MTTILLSPGKGIQDRVSRSSIGARPESGQSGEPAGLEGTATHVSVAGLGRVADTVQWRLQIE